MTGVVAFIHTIFYQKGSYHFLDNLYSCAVFCASQVCALAQILRVKNLIFTLRHHFLSDIVIMAAELNLLLKINYFSCVCQIGSHIITLLFATTVFIKLRIIKIIIIRIKLALYNRKCFAKTLEMYDFPLS